MTTDNDPLNEDLTMLDTSFPLLAGDIYDLKVNKAELMTNDAGTVKLELSTTQPAKSNKGEDLSTGTKVFTNVNTNPTGKSTLEMVKRSVASIIQASQLGTKTLNEFKGAVKTLEGKVLRARVIIEPEGTGKDGVFRKARNGVAEWIKQ